MRSDLPVLGIIGDSRLKERGLVEMMEVAQCVAIAPLDSVMHRMLDYSCPVPTLDLSFAALNDVVVGLSRRGIQLNAILSLRDGNVADAARITAGLQSAEDRRAIELYALDVLSDKYCFREWLTRQGQAIPHAPVRYREISRTIDKDGFREQVQALYGEPSEPRELIFKPKKGSCSQFIIEMSDLSQRSLNATWSRIQEGRRFRGGDFIVEEKIRGPEFSIDTIVAEEVIGHFVARYKAPPRGRFYAVGASVPPAPELTSQQRSAIRDLTYALHQRLGLKNLVTHLEIKFDNDSALPSIVELNPRLAGGMLPELYRLVYGVELYRIVASLALRRFDQVQMRSLPSSADLAVDRFAEPFEGRLGLAKAAKIQFGGCNDRFSALIPLDSHGAFGSSDDDLRVWTLASGRLKDRQDINELFQELSLELDSRLDTWLVKDSPQQTVRSKLRSLLRKWRSNWF